MSSENTQRFLILAIVVTMSISVWSGYLYSQTYRISQESKLELEVTKQKLVEVDELLSEVNSKLETANELFSEGTRRLQNADDIPLEAVELVLSNGDLKITNQDGEALFDDLLSGDLGAQTIDQNAVTLALLITIGLIAGYHWWVYRSDRAMLPDEEHVGPIRELIIVAPEGLDTAAIAGATGARVRVMRRTDEVAVDVDAVVAALEETESERVMVVTTESGEVHVIPLGSTL